MTGAYIRAVIHFSTLSIAMLLAPSIASATVAFELGTRPLDLIADMRPSELRNRLSGCAKDAPSRSNFSIAHRGAPLKFPEHTRTSYLAAMRMGAGVVECDVTFTADGELVCRHSQCDLHRTTNILLTPLASKCSEPFTPADPVAGTGASATCCASDITLAEFTSLCGRNDVVNPKALTVSAYLDDQQDWRTRVSVGAPYEQRISCSADLMTHAQSIALFAEHGVHMTPELKAPMVQMPFDTNRDGVADFSREDYARALIAQYRSAGVSPQQVWPQSFDLEDLLVWRNHAPDFAKQAVYLVGDYSHIALLCERETGNASASCATVQEQALQYESALTRLVDEGVAIIAPPLWMLVSLQQGRIVPSSYAIAARKAGLKIIAWTFERTHSLAESGHWFYQSIEQALQRDGDKYEVLHVLAEEVGVIGVFSDWPASVTYYANCMGLE